MEGIIIAAGISNSYGVGGVDLTRQLSNDTELAVSMGPVSQSYSGTQGVDLSKQAEATGVVSDVGNASVLDDVLIVVGSDGNIISAQSGSTILDAQMQQKSNITNVWDPPQGNKSVSVETQAASQGQATAPGASPPAAEAAITELSSALSVLLRCYKTKG